MEGGKMSLVFNAGAFAMRNQLTAGMQLRSSLRSFAKENNLLSKKDEEFLDALDDFEQQQIEREARRKHAEKNASSIRQRSNVFSSLCAPRATTSQQAAQKAKQYEAQALSLAQQARVSAVIGDDAAAQELERRSLEATQYANQMYAQEMQLARQEAQERKAKLDREAQDYIEEKKAKQAAEAALRAMKQRRLQEAEQKRCAALNHLETARKAKRKRQQADIEAWGRRVTEGQFWIRQMQLAQRGEHPAQRLAQASLDAYREANSSVTAIAPSFTPGVERAAGGAAGSDAGRGVSTGSITTNMPEASSYLPEVIAA
ncbi:hypothetical protein FYZ40_00490 [Mobiluncus mulieris]|nr:hypothetical protein [Mobiluncus mulieris]